MYYVAIGKKVDVQAFSFSVSSVPLPSLNACFQETIMGVNSWPYSVDNYPVQTPLTSSRNTQQKVRFIV